MLRSESGGVLGGRASGDGIEGVIVLVTTVTQRLLPPDVETPMASFYSGIVDGVTVTLYGEAT
jgi:hypothetical protein